jgi:hypothetical protein
MYRSVYIKGLVVAVMHNPNKPHFIEGKQVYLRDTPHWQWYRGQGGFAWALRIRSVAIDINWFPER